MSKNLPSHQAIDNVNSAPQHPKYLVLDDTNVDLLTFFIVASTFVSLFIFRTFALITGASSGIGAELAYIFARNGHDVVLVGRNDDQLTAVKDNIEKQYGRKCYMYVEDLSVPGASSRLYEKVKGDGLVVEVLVNDAALGHAGDVMDQFEDLPERMIHLNCITLVQLTQFFGKDMIQRGRGWILELSSVVGWMVGPGQNLYHATKHFVRAFSEAMSVELRGTNVVLTQLMPGSVHTQFVPRAQLQNTFTFSLSGTVEDPRAVAQAGYDGLCKGKRMVFSSWNAAFMATSMHLMPRSLHVTMGSLMNSPTRAEMAPPKSRQ